MSLLRGSNRKCFPAAEGIRSAAPLINMLGISFPSAAAPGAELAASLWGCGTWQGKHGKTPGTQQPWILLGTLVAMASTKHKEG